VYNKCVILLSKWVTLNAGPYIGPPLLYAGMAKLTEERRHAHRASLSPQLSDWLLYHETNTTQSHDIHAPLHGFTNHSVS
jgi:hypothetical protein